MPNLLFLHLGQVPKTVTIPEDSEETHLEEDEAQEQDSQEKSLRAEDYEAMMQSVYQIAAETAKSVVTVRGEQDFVIHFGLAHFTMPCSSSGILTSFFSTTS